ncbi:MAG: tetratricopeptide repeat protein [Deltaproteobacteria bacterium]|nr:tetratricopeptide repeat protein [Deltaproteobacteria bacterium]
MKQPLVGANALKQAFPQMPVGEEFQGFFDSSATKGDRFAVLVIRIDDFDRTLKQLGEDITSGVVVRLARIIDGLSKTRSIEWGRLDQKRFACFCPDTDEEASVQLAKEIQRRLALVGEETVSVGVAVHPFWPFEKMTILDNAQKALDHAVFFGPNTVTPFDAVSLNISADKLYQYGDIDGAIEEFRRALAVDLQNVNVRNSLGVCYGVQGKLDLAIDAFETAIRLDPEDVMATYNLGLAHFKQGDGQKALSLFLKAHSLDGDNPEVAYQIAVCYREKDQTEAALEYLAKAAQNTRKGGHIFQALGECYLEKEMLKEAAKAYEKAIRHNPTDPKSLSDLGHLYGALGENMEIAIVLCRESTRIDPNNGLYRYRLGKLYLQSKDYENALEQLKMAAELGEDCSDLIREVIGATLCRPANDFGRGKLAPTAAKARKQTNLTQ